MRNPIDTHVYWEDQYGWTHYFNTLMPDWTQYGARMVEWVLGQHRDMKSILDFHGEDAQIGPPLEWDVAMFGLVEKARVLAEAER